MPFLSLVCSAAAPEPQRIAVAVYRNGKGSCGDNVSMSIVHLVRHAQASFGAEDYDALSELGFRQARWLGEYFSARGLRFARVMSGTMVRQQATARAILQAMGEADETLLSHEGLNEYPGEALYAAHTGVDPRAHQLADARAYWRTFRLAMQAWSEERLVDVPESWIDFGARVRAALAEAVRDTGAVGVMLNHAERKLTLPEIASAIARADEVGLATMVCADTEEEIRAVAALEPNIIVAEPSDLIGTGIAVGREYVKACVKLVADVNKNILVLPSAGISSGQDCYNIIRAGAVASGSSSGICKAPDRAAMAEEMIVAVRRAWDEARHLWEVSDAQRKH